MKNLILKDLVFLLLISLNLFSQDGKFTFTISSPVTTSAGVFKNDSILVRTLWSNVKYDPGTYTKVWDGLDDYGNIISSPASSYKIKVLSNNVQYKWQGTIGNSSDSMTGRTKHKGAYDCMKGLVFIGNYGYFCTGYSEGSPSVCKFNIATPNQKINMYASFQPTGEVNYVATDGVNIYWSALDPFSPNNTWVFGTKVSDDKETSFSSGVSYTLNIGNKTFPYAISKLNQSNAYITGLAVQKTADYLFVARASLNQLQVLNKTTGALVRTLTYTNVRTLNVDNNNNLWMVTGTNTVAKYTVNSDGTLTAATLTLSGLLSPLAIQVSNDGTAITVADGSTSQQVKAFNNSTGASVWTLGTAGGYFTDATVNDYKFYFNDVRENKFPFIAFQTDGSLWVGDPGNFRAQHYNSSRTYMNRIMSLGSTYTTWADKNNINRVFSGYMEFAIDYSVQTLTGSTGWTLVKNWGANVTTAYDDFLKIRYQTTLSNGRTYALLNKGPYKEIVELMPTGTLRYGGKLLTGSRILCSDGSMQEPTQVGTLLTYKRYPLTGFDGSGHPSWSNTGEILASATISDNLIGNPVTYTNIQIFDATNKVVFFNPNSLASNTGPVYTTGYHLGLMAKGANDTYLFQTEKSTQRNYTGLYPQAGWFDVGNAVNSYAGGNVNIIGRNIITSYHGEFWKNSQTNKYNHYYDNGLAIGQFGITGPEAGYGVGRSGDPVAEFAGNVLTPVVVKDAGGDLYLWHGDESVHAGLHRWKITGLNSISEQVITIAFPSAYAAPATTYTDLMVGLPFDATMENGVAGWTRNPVSNNSKWKVKTSYLTYDKANTTDFIMQFDETAAATNTVNRDLGTNNIINNWKVTGQIIYLGSIINSGPNYAYLEVLDDAGKVLTTFYVQKSGVAHPTYTSVIRGNTSTIFTKTEYYSPTLDTLIDKIRPFEISIVGGVVTFKYAGLPPVTTTISDATGDWRKPRTLRQRFINDGGPAADYGINIDLSDLKFYKDYSVTPLPNQPPIAIAGTDKIVTLPVNTATLTGSGTDPDGSIASYSWTKISGPLSSSIATPNAASTLISGLLQGVYQFELIVTDNNGATGKDTVQVTVNAAPAPNLLPAVNPSNTVNGLDYKYYEGRWNVLPAFSSLNPVKTGTTTNFNLSLANRASDHGFSFTGFVTVPSGGQYTFYTSSDDGSNLYIDNVLIVANDGLHSTVEKSGIIGLEAGKHAITGLFFQQGGGEVFQVSYEGMGISKQAIPESKLYRITLVNAAPVAFAGPDQTVSLPTSAVTLTGSGTDADGVIASYSWSKISGPLAGLIVTPNVASTLINSLIQGVYQYELTVTDDKGAIGKDTVQVTVNAPGIILLPSVNPANTVNGLDYKYYEGTWNELPIFSTLTPVKTGITTNFNLSLANRTTKYGFNFTGYVEVPADGQYTFYTNSDDGSNLYIDNVLTVANDGLHSPTEKSGIIGLKAGKHYIAGLFFQQTVGAVFTVSYEGMGISKQPIPSSALYRVNTANKTRVANVAANHAPVANAGSDISITLPASNIVLSGSGTDSDGTIESYAWVKISGPSGDMIATPNAAITSITSLVPGIYQYQLTVTDNSGASSSDSVQVTVNSISGNQKQTKSTAAANYSISKLLVVDSVNAAESRIKPLLKIPGMNGFKVYPNPAKEFANLSITTILKNDQLSISVYNSIGMLVKSRQLNTPQLNTLYKLDMSGLNKGIYYIIIRFRDGQKISNKLVKE